MNAPSKEVRLYRQEIAASVKKHWKDDPIELSLLIRENWDEEIAEGKKPDSYNYVIFIDIEGDIDWLYKGYGKKESMSEKSEIVMSRAMSIEGLPCNGLDEENRECFKKMIGEAMALAIDENIKDALGLLKQAKCYYQDRIVEKSRVWSYWFTALVGLAMGTFIGLGVCMFGDGISCIKWSFMYGLLGAIIANIRRTNSNLTDSNAGKWLHFWNTFGHLISGIVFGYAGVLLSLSPLCPEVLKNVGNSFEGMAIIAFASGLFETFIPTTLSNCLTTQLKESEVCA